MGTQIGLAHSPRMAWHDGLRVDAAAAGQAQQRAIIHPHDSARMPLGAETEAPGVHPVTQLVSSAFSRYLASITLCPMPGWHRRRHVNPRPSLPESPSAPMPPV